MRVLMVSKACLVGTYQRKLEEMAACPDLQLTVAVPAAWRDERGTVRLERSHTRGYELVVEPLAFNGSFHLHYYPQLGRRIAELKPDLVHIDEEPYNLATWHALRQARRHGARSLFFSWQNLQRRYPWPFNYFERQVLRNADGAIVGNQEGLLVWRAKSYTGPIQVIPQFGVDPQEFQPARLVSARSSGSGPFVVGYAGRLAFEKGVDVLLRAVAQLPDAVHVHVVGAGPERGRLGRLSRQLGITGRVRWTSLIPSAQMPAMLASFDCLVLPSRTRPNWKEQFGRVLIEAMACGVPVVGSTCGELPNVIGSAGRLFPEADAQALARQLHELWQQPDRGTALGELGRERVLTHYTQRQVAEATVGFYHDLLSADA
jgi:glycosyltransferase involved in cell wall biosynthesis